MARSREYKVVTATSATALETTLSGLSVDGWEVVGFDWNDGGADYVALLCR